MATALMVWIDQDLCTGDGICEEICGDVFTARDDGGAGCDSPCHARVCSPYTLPVVQ